MILLVDPNPALRAHVSGVLGRDGRVIDVDRIAELHRLLEERGALVEVVVLGPDLPSADALRAADTLQIKAPDVSVLMIASSLLPDLLHAAMRAGVKDVLPVGFDPAQLTEAVERAESIARQIRGRATHSEAVKRGNHKVVTVFSSKGGCGKSVISSNLALLLAQTSGQSVALVDLDLQSGDLAIMLGILPAWTIYDAAEHIDRLDPEALRGYLTPHRGGVMLLAAPLEPSLAEAVTAEAIRRVIGLLKESFTHVVVDGPASFTDQVLAALDETDEVVLVTSMDVPSIKNLKLSLQTLEQLGFGRQRIKLVLNRADSKVGLSVSEVEKTLRTSIDVSIPSSREIPLSVNQGVPLAAAKTKSPVVRALTALADAVRIPADRLEGHRSAPARG